MINIIKTISTSKLYLEDLLLIVTLMLILFMYYRVKQMNKYIDITFTGFPLIWIGGGKRKYWTEIKGIRMNRKQ